jgi:hypothetical protein
VPVIGDLHYRRKNTSRRGSAGASHGRHRVTSRSLLLTNGARLRSAATDTRRPCLPAVHCRSSVSSFVSGRIWVGGVFHAAAIGEEGRSGSFRCGAGATRRSRGERRSWLSGPKRVLATSLRRSEYLEVHRTAQRLAHAAPNRGMSQIARAVRTASVNFGVHSSVRSRASAGCARRVAARSETRAAAGRRRAQASMNRRVSWRAG